MLCFERLCPKQNTVSRLKSKYLLPPEIWAGYATAHGLCYKNAKIFRVLFQFFQRLSLTQLNKSN